MCVNKKRIYNKWTKQWLWVDCGHCPACQQAKANKRLQRIKNASTYGYVPLFVTLTYANVFLPYIDIDDLYADAAVLPIRRDGDVRRVRVPGSFRCGYNMAYRYKDGEKILDVIDCLDKKIFIDDDTLFPRAVGAPRKVGVIYYKDIQDFEKRLAINLKRRYRFEGSYKIFKCAEYGAKNFRPHFHLLVYVPAADVVTFTNAISEAWPYDFKVANKRKVEIAKNASSYVSAYVNRGSDFPSFLENKPFRPKHSFSQGFGLANPQFTLPSFLQAVDRGDLNFTTWSCKHGVREYVDIQYPKYFINRYFIKFKGYSRLDDNTLFDLIQRPLLIYKYGFSLGYVEDDFEKTISSIRIRFHRFLNECNISGSLDDLLYLFAHYYVRVFRVLSSLAYKHMFDDVDDDVGLLECFENLDEVRGFPDFRCNEDLKKKIFAYPEIEDPSFYLRVKRQSRQLSDVFERTCKRKKVTNTAYSEAGMLI